MGRAPLNTRGDVRWSAAPPAAPPASLELTREVVCARASMGEAGIGDICLETSHEPPTSPPVQRSMPQNGPPPPPVQSRPVQSSQATSPPANTTLDGHVVFELSASSAEIETRPPPTAGGEAAGEGAGEAAGEGAGGEGAGGKGAGEAKSAGPVSDGWADSVPTEDASVGIREESSASASVEPSKMTASTARSGRSTDGGAMETVVSRVHLIGHIATRLSFTILGFFLASVSWFVSRNALQSTAAEWCCAVVIHATNAGGFAYVGHYLELSSRIREASRGEDRLARMHMCMDVDVHACVAQHAKSGRDATRFPNPHAPTTPAPRPRPSTTTAREHDGTWRAPGGERSLHVRHQRLSVAEMASAKDSVAEMDSGARRSSEPRLPSRGSSSHGSSSSSSQLGSSRWGLGVGLALGLALSFEVRVRVRVTVTLTLTLTSHLSPLTPTPTVTVALTLTLTLTLGAARPAPPADAFLSPRRDARSPRRALPTDRKSKASIAHHRALVERLVRKCLGSTDGGQARAQHRRATGRESDSELTPSMRHT